MKFSTSNFFFVVASLLLLKLLGFGFSLGEALGAFVILAAIQSHAVTEYFFPKRQDLFKEMHELQMKFDNVLAKHEEMETDVTALKFGAMRK